MANPFSIAPCIANHMPTEPERPIPESFFKEADHSDEDLGDIITGSQYSMEAPKDDERNWSQLPLSQEAPEHRLKSASKVAAMNPFRPINTLSPAPKPQPGPQLPKKFGAGYSQRVRDAFSDSEEADPQPVDDCGPTPKEEHNLTTDDPPKPKETSSPASADTDTTSVLITNQLTQDAPPSNQELGILMSSSPSRRCAASEHSPTRHPPPPLGSEKRGSSISSSEPSSGIPARLTPRRASTLLERPQQQDEETNTNRFAPPSAMYIKSGIAERRVTRPKKEVAVQVEPKPEAITQRGALATPKRAQKFKDCDADLDVTPNFELALSQVETPSTKARSTQRSPVVTSGAKSKKSEKSVRFDEADKLVVKIPMMSAKNQAMYGQFPAIEANETSLPLKSFQEINRDGDDVVSTSPDSGATALEHVLKDSPEWLRKVTEVAPNSRGESSNRRLYPAQSLATNTLSKTPLKIPTKTPTKEPTETPSKTSSKIARTGIAPKRKRDSGSGTDEVDSVYSPSASEWQSDDSLSAGGVRRKSRQTQEGTARKVQGIRAPLPREAVAVATPQEKPKVKTNINKPSAMFRTPVPAPTIASLLKKIKGSPKTDTVLERAKSVPYTPIPPPVIPVLSTKQIAILHTDQAVQPDEETKQKRRERRRQKRERSKQRKKAEKQESMVK
jgi:hypothetical protein